MIRRLLDVLAALSLALCVVVVALWARSYWASDRVGRVRYTPGVWSEDHHIYLDFGRGTASLVVGGDRPECFTHARWVWQRSRPDAGPFGMDEPRALRAVGIGWERPRSILTGETTWRVQVRLALPALLAAAGTLPVAFRRTRPAVARNADGRGFDTLRSDPVSGC